MQVVLVMFRSDGERRSFSVVRNMTVIGRREDCDLRIPVGDVSRKHCRLVRTDDGIRIEDLGSSNGTHVNGQRIQESDLNAGDVVGIGPVKFIVQIDGVPADEDLAPPEETLVSQAHESSMMGTPAAPPEPPSHGSGLDGAAEEEEFQLEEEPVAAAGHEESSLELTEEPARSRPAVPEIRRPEIPLPELELTELPTLDSATPDSVTPDSVTLDEAPPDSATLDEVPLEPAAHEVDEPEFQIEEDTSSVEHTLVEHPVPEAVEPLELEEVTTPAEEIEPVDLEAGGESEWDFVVEEADAEPNEHNFQVDLDSTHEQPHGKA